MICSDRLHSALVSSYPPHQAHSMGTLAEVEGQSVKIVFCWWWINKKRAQRVGKRLAVFTKHLRRIGINEIVIQSYHLFISSDSVECSDGVCAVSGFLASPNQTELSVIDRTAIMSWQSDSKPVSRAGQLETDLMLILDSLAEGRSYSTEVNQVNSV